MVGFQKLIEPEGKLIEPEGKLIEPEGKFIGHEGKFIGHEGKLIHRKPMDQTRQPGISYICAKFFDFQNDGSNHVRAISVG